MNNKKLTTLWSLHNEAQDWLKAELINELENKTYRDMSLVTGLNLKQINRIVKGDTEIKINSLVRACNKLLSQKKAAKNGN